MFASLPLDSAKRATSSQCLPRAPPKCGDAASVDLGLDGGVETRAV